VSVSRQALEDAFRLALAHQQSGQPAEAERLYRQILEADPRHGEALQQLALLARNHGYLEEAEGLLRQAVAAAPRNAEFHNTLGTVYAALGKSAEAEQAYRLAIKRRAGYAQAMSNLAALLNDALRHAEAIEWAGRAAAIRPDYAPALNNLALALTRQGRVEEAVQAYRRCVAAEPRRWPLWSNLLVGMHYLPEVTAQELFEMHLHVGRGLSEGLGTPAPHANRRDAGRRLRVGYVSADFRMHSVAHFALPILENHDRSAVEVFCYSDVTHPDAVTERAKSLADGWRPIGGLSDDAAAQAVRQDAIDILVDLSGHMSGRLALFARKPAPLQLTYLGYPDTTGLPAMDYRLTDSVADPAGEADRFATEKLIRIDPCAWCYAPVHATPEVAAPRSGAITFGSFNILAKLSAPTLETWGSLLRELPGSRLKLKSFAANEPAVREQLARGLRDQGIEPARLEVLGHQDDAREHLARYGEIDIALDPFPYNGTTTTCEALWMGVPVVTLAGARHAGRVGASLLRGVGLEELIAKDRESYVAATLALASDRSRLAGLRAELRGRMQRSPLMDAAGFCRRLEAVYREMWHGWCSQARL